MGLVETKPVFGTLRTTKAHTSPCRLINAFVICFLESIISELGTSKISIVWLVSVAEETGLNLILSETPKIGFGETRPIWHNTGMGEGFPSRNV